MAHNSVRLNYLIFCYAGPSGDFKNKKGVDAGGRVLKGKGVYQFVDKYGANVDGYSPIYAREEWSAGGDSYAGGE